MSQIYMNRKCKHCNEMVNDSYISFGHPNVAFIWNWKCDKCEGVNEVLTYSMPMYGSNTYHMEEWQYSDEYLIDKIKKFCVIDISKTNFVINKNKLDVFDSIVNTKSPFTFMNKFMDKKENISYDLETLKFKCDKKDDMVAQLYYSECIVEEV